MRQKKKKITIEISTEPLHKAWDKCLDAGMRLFKRIEKRVDPYLDRFVIWYDKFMYKFINVLLTGMIKFASHIMTVLDKMLAWRNEHK